MDILEEGQKMGGGPQTPSKMGSTPGTPLQQISPERLNQRIPLSPSLPINLDHSGRKQQQHRLSDASEVKARVAYLNAITGSPTRGSSPTKSFSQTASHAAIQRAIVGREEAEAALNAMTAQLESAKAREKLVAERVESLMEQLQEARNRQRHERQVYEKEMKTSKKNEYKAELAVIKLQEELKEVKNELEGYRARAEHNKHEKEKARQEAFERAYAVAGMTEEIQTLKDQLQVVEQERDQAVATAASRMPTEEIRAVEKKVDSIKAEEEATLGKRKRPMPEFDTMPKLTLADGMDPNHENSTIEAKYAILQREVMYLKRQRQEDQELIHFMNMQCQFKACPCRMAERNGSRFVHDYEYDRKVRDQNAKKRKIEGENPVPVHTSRTKNMEGNDGRQNATEDLKHNQPSVPQVIDVTSDAKERQPVGQMQPDPNVMAEPVAPLPPVYTVTDESRSSIQIEEAIEAAKIPLPSATEDTAQLEEFTQVMVNPANVTKPAFTSAFASKGLNPVGAAPRVQPPQSSLRLSEELFNLSPPKRAPPRPSTAMGIITTDSPIRFVQDSPKPHSATSENLQMHTQLQTTRIALNDTTSQYNMPSQHRPRSRVDARHQPGGPSPGARFFDSQPDSTLDLPSPASSTIFPITPIPKNPRQEVTNVAYNQSRGQHQSQSYSHAPFRTETTTTTTVPLRGDDDDDSSVLATSQGSTASAPSAPIIKDSHGIAGTPVISREAALAQIRARRDRARSVNMRKAEQESRADNDRKGSKTPGSAARRGVKIDLGHRNGLANQGERGRDFSQASAPGRF